VLRAQWSEGIGVMPLGQRVGVVPEQPNERGAAKVLGSDHRVGGVRQLCAESVVEESTVVQVKVTVIRTFPLDDRRVDCAGESHYHPATVSVLSCRLSTHRSSTHRSMVFHFSSIIVSSRFAALSTIGVRVVPCHPLTRTPTRCLLLLSFPSRLFPLCAVIFTAGR